MVVAALPTVPRVFQLYTLHDPANTSDVRYVGYTCQSFARRFSRHLLVSGHTHRENWVKEVVSAGRLPVMTSIDTAETIERAHELERHYIKWYRASGHSLTNATDGGDGSLGSNPSAETRRKISIAGTGRHPSAETRLKMSLNNGRNRPDVAKRISDALRGRSVSLETRAKQSAARLGRTITPPWREKLRAASLAACSTPAALQRLSAAGVIGNHIRWHGSIKNQECVLCQP